MKKNIKASIILIISIVALFSCEKEVPTVLDLSTTNLLLPNINAEATVEITANGNWTASVASTWCTVSPTSGNGNGILKIIATDNVGDKERSVTVSINSKEITKYAKITQDVPSLELDNIQFNFSKEASSASLTISSNTAWEIAIPSNIGWIAATPDKGEGNANVSFSISNNIDAERSADIEILYSNKSKIVTIVQERGKNGIPSSPVLKAPLADAVNISRLPAFRWSTSNDPDGDHVSYIFEYGINPDSWDVSIPVDDTVYYMPAYLESNTKYFWQVTAVDEFEGKSSTISQNSFTTGISTSYFNGEYRLYQENTKGQKPSVIIFMGDGYQAEDHVDGGRYDNHLDEGIEAFFSVEPYKSYREYFTVYKVGAYSRDSGVKQTDKNLMKHSVFETDFLGGSSLSTNTDKVFDYARVVPGIDDEALKNTLIVLVVNENRYAGTCWMWSDGKAIAIVPVSRSGQDEQAYPNIVNHEAGGHGYGRLADEYISSQNIGKTLPESDVTSFQSWVRNGFYPNVDLTGNLNEVKWKYFLGEPGYSRVGTYEGAYYYAYGAWRPETSSCMVHNEQYYNAPSREAMVKRILKTAGETFSFEIFLEKDVQKSPDAKMATKSFNPLTFIPLAPPVMVR
ncbi:MAG: M64 family metallopeptidase [Bacteroidales bacterium]|nr:M64 family metallopeptidase [Bacteroidales bacterium]MDD3843485.1 M64 family metallopeptidase [Bacteroidales bacterium]MDD4617774.1 M64 family metallopeptidase [Bacteroidales bacterium]